MNNYLEVISFHEECELDPNVKKNLLGREMFETALRDVLAWTDRTKRALSETVHPVSVAHAEELMKKHYELGEQLKNKKYEVRRKLLIRINRRRMFENS